MINKKIIYFFMHACYTVRGRVIEMQADMHYYGTLAMALAAGIPRQDAETIACAAQFVDDSTGHDSEEHEDHGLLYAISTAHHPLQSFMDRLGAKIREGTEEQRKIWVPFHFLPGGRGKTLSEKLLCVKNSGVAREMLGNNLDAALKRTYGLELMGITAHVYMDTFSHYGFSGIASSFNRIKNDTVVFTKEPETGGYIREKFRRFAERYVVASAAQEASRCLGHAGAATYPDRPYLQWRFDFERPRPDNGATSIRDNGAAFLEGCRCLHAFFSTFAQAKYAETDGRLEFKDIEETVRKVIAREADMEGRVKAWDNSGLIDGCGRYDPQAWEREKEMFSRYAVSGDGIATNAYRFHQAASFHRYYVLKDLLPSHGIAVY
jgi:hypothetical protein